MVIRCRRWLCLIVPFVLLLAQLAMWYEFKPLVPGKAALVEVALTPEAWADFELRDDHARRGLTPSNWSAIAWITRLRIGFVHASKPSVIIR